MIYLIGMKNANVFLVFIFLILLIYPVSIYSYNTSKKVDLSSEPVFLSNFSYKVIDENREVFIKGDSLTKYHDKQIIEKPQGYYINNQNKKIDFKADVVTNYLTEEKVELQKNILISENNNSIETNKIIFNQKTNTIYAPDSIKIFFDNSLIEGRDLIYDLNSKKIILKNTRGKLWLSKIKF